MKLVICSDIHGDLSGARAAIEALKRENADKLLILGDVLYHGPRNSLPTEYNPKAVIELLNANKNLILCVRGNCDTEVDQMVLEFPILADYAVLSLDGLTVYATHGHKYNTSSVPPLSCGDILLHGHTHVLCAKDFGDGNVYINPGSISIPKENNPRTYAVYENHEFIIKDLDGNIILNRKFNI